MAEFGTKRTCKEEKEEEEDDADYSLQLKALSAMAEFGTKRTCKEEEEEDDDDYMGDLSAFLPQELSNPRKRFSEMVNSDKTLGVQSTKKKFKNLSWQEQRKLNKKERQFEEDKRTLAKVEAPISQSNIGFKLLKKMGYNPGTGLGKEGEGRAEPVGLEIRRSRGGIGIENAVKEKRRKELLLEEMKRQNEEALVEDFGVRQKSQWRGRRVAVNYLKGKAALDQLENKEVVVVKKSEDEGVEEEEEEEEEITEEDLQDILMKLREEHRYCLFCGCQYESMEALLSNCPGTDEDDH